MGRTIFQEKFRESLAAVGPVVAIILLLCLSVSPIPVTTLVVFLFGAVLLTVGMVFFNMGAEMAISPMGQRIGTGLVKTRKLWIILPVAFFLGFMINMSEPDLQVLSRQMQDIPGDVLIVTISVGVGLFLVLAMLRIFFGWKLQKVLVTCYIIVLAFSLFVPKSFLAVAFDSGGVTTGPMTVPFIMALGVGISHLRTDSSASDDSFGLISLCSVGPILAVLLLSLIYVPQGASYTMPDIPQIEASVEITSLFAEALPEYFKDIAQALIPLVLFFLVFSLLTHKLEKDTLIPIFIGVFYTYIGLVVFLTGANVGFIPMGSLLGGTLASVPWKWVIVPIGMLIGWFIVKAEPAVYVLEKQVEEITMGAVSGKALQSSLSYGVAASVGLALVRVLTGMPILYLIIPGYALAIILSFFAPPIFTAIAFDSGGVASGPMTSTFLLPFAEGACIAVGGNVVTDAFGIVAMVAMTPLIAIQLLGISYKVKKGRVRGPVSVMDQFAGIDNMAIIDL